MNGSDIVTYFVRICNSGSRYKEYNCLISKYFNKKLNDNETLEETMSKISPKFKTPIKYKTKFLTSKDENRKIKCYKRPRYYIIDTFIDNEKYLNKNEYAKNTINLSKINNINNKYSKNIIFITIIKYYCPTF